MIVDFFNMFIESPYTSEMEDKFWFKLPKEDTAKIYFPVYITLLLLTTLALPSCGYNKGLGIETIGEVVTSQILANHHGHYIDFNSKREITI